MRALVITQDDPFYLPQAIPDLFDGIEGRHEIIGCILLSASPFGKRERFLRKTLKTWQIFGSWFFLRYGVRFLQNKIFSPNAMERVFRCRGVPVIRLSQSINAKVSLDQISSFAPDVLISIAGNEIFKRPLIDLAPNGCLNLHSAMLPKYRGLMPTFWVLRFRESRTGVSVFLVDEGIDSGPIVVQEAVDIGCKTQEQLIRETKKIGMQSIAAAMDILESQAPALLENNAADATYFGFPTAEDVKEFKKAGAKFF